MSITVTTSPTQINNGTAHRVKIVNLGAVDVLISPGQARLRPGGTQIVYTSGNAVSVRTVAGSSSVDVTTYAAPWGTPGAGGGFTPVTDYFIDASPSPLSMTTDGETVAIPWDPDYGVTPSLVAIGAGFSASDAATGITVVEAGIYQINLLAAYQIVGTLIGGVNTFVETSAAKVSILDLSWYEGSASFSTSPSPPTALVSTGAVTPPLAMPAGFEFEVFSGVSRSGGGTLHRNIAKLAVTRFA